MKSRKEIWDRKKECEFTLQHFFSAVQNPVELTEDDLKYINHSYDELMRNIQLAKLEMDRFIGSKEYWEEIEDNKPRYEDE